MDKTTLLQAGIDYDEGLRRFGGIAGLYEKYLLKFFSESLLTELEALLGEGNYDAAEKKAHAIKGTAGNLSIAAVYAHSCALVTLLRTKGAYDLPQIATELREMQQAYAIARTAVVG